MRSYVCQIKEESWILKEEGWIQYGQRSLLNSLRAYRHIILNLQLFLDGDLNKSSYWLEWYLVISGDQVAE